MQLSRPGTPAAGDRIGVLRAALRGQAARAMSAAAALETGPVDLPGPTGESNQFQLAPRGRVLCLGPDPQTLVAQVVQALAAGNAVLTVAAGAPEHLAPLLKEPRLPLMALDGICPVQALETLGIDALACGGTADLRAPLRQALARREGPILTLISEVISPVSYCTERTICIDTTAAGGNASLLAQVSA